MDDNKRFLAVAQDHLTREGMDVVGTATTGADALRQAVALRPDVVLVDIFLGTDSGFDVARRLVDEFPELHGRVVLISSHDREDFEDLIADSPAIGFVPKNNLSARTIYKVLSTDG